MRMPLIIVGSEEQEKELNDVVENGLAGDAAVDTAGELVITWTLLKTKK